jgi:hypothetical protein
VVEDELVFVFLPEDFLVERLLRFIEPEPEVVPMVLPEVDMPEPDVLPEVDIPDVVPEVVPEVEPEVL